MKAIIFFLLLAPFIVEGITSTKANTAEGIAYVELGKSGKRKSFFQGVIKRGNTAKLGFIDDVQVQYVAPVNTMVNGAIVDLKGKTVSKGDVIAVARHKSQSIQLQIAKFNLKKAESDLVDNKRDFDRNSKLYRRKVYSEKEYSDAENLYINALNDYEVARLNIDNAQAELDKRIIQAPFRGVIEEVYHVAGSTVESAAPVVRISVLSPMRISVELPNALIRNLSVNDNFKIYQLGSRDAQGAWLDSKGIFADHIELLAENKIVPVGTLTEAQKKFPIVNSIGISTHIVSNPDYPVWVPESSIVQEGKNHYVWAAKGQTACEVDHPIAKEFVVEKIKVVPADAITNNFTGRYQALKKGAIKQFQIVVLNPTKKLQHGKLAVLQETRMQFRPGDKAWVHIPMLSEFSYIVPKKAVLKYKGDQYVFVVEQGRVMPVNVKTNIGLDNLMTIIGDGLKVGMKILVPEKNQHICPTQKVKLGKKIEQHIH